MCVADNALQLAPLKTGPSGQTFDLDEARKLAISHGFTFDGLFSAAPDSKRANLAELFAHHDVNCLSALRRKLGFGIPVVPQSGGRSPQQPAEQDTAAAIVSGQYSGPMQRGLRDGMGSLVYEIGGSAAQYQGQFVDGAREGLGVIVAGNGARFEGSFRGDLMWGPGVFHFAPPQHRAADGAPAEEAHCHPHPHRVAFEGMFNGRPQGWGVLLLSDGSRVHGRADGVRMEPAGSAEEQAECEAAAAAGTECAKAAQAVLRQAQGQG